MCPFIASSSAADFGRDVAGGAEVRPRLLPGRAHLVRLDRSRADVQPVGLGDVPRIAAQIVVQQQLGLTVTPGARARDRRAIGLELVLLDADRPARPRRRDQASHRAVGSASAHQMARAQAGDRPEPVAVARDVVNRDAQVQIGAAAAQQKVVELEATDEPAVTADAPLLAAIADVAGRSTPTGRRDIRAAPAPARPRSAPRSIRRTA